MRGSDHACTWKPRGPQDQFVSAADVSGACFGHMVASVWDGSVVRRRDTEEEAKREAEEQAGCEAEEQAKRAAEEEFKREAEEKLQMEREEID